MKRKVASSSDSSSTSEGKVARVDADAKVEHDREGLPLIVNVANKVEMELDEVKQAIKDVQVVIMNVREKIEKVGTEVEATKMLLLSDKVSPMDRSIHTQNFESLIAEKKALMEEKKAVMDKEKALMEEKKALMEEKKALMEEMKALISNLTQETAVTPFEFSASSSMNFPNSGCGNAMFKREWFINDIADMVLVKNGENKYDSYYWRAPAASGKTVFLNLIGRKLQDRGCVVYLLDTSAELEVFKKYYFHQLARDAGDKTVVLMVDEVQNNIYSRIWTEILRERRPNNLLVLGVGIPQMILPSPQFTHKFPEEGKLFPMFLTNRDLPEVVDFFRSQSSPSGGNITKVCDEILQYTNGHLYPFVKIMEHILSSSTKIEGDIGLYLSSQEFRNSSAYANIKGRCSFAPYMLDPALRILTNKGSAGDFETLEKLGILVDEVFISQFVLNEVFLRMKGPIKVDKFLLDESKGISVNSELIIYTGLRYLVAEDFKDINPDYHAVENAISMKWGCNIMRTIDNIKMYFQARTMYEEHTGRGAKPLIDFVFNGRLDLGIEIAVDLNADGVKEHLQRFDHKYATLKKNGIVLHIDTVQSQPVVIKSLGKDSNDKIYTFIASRNELYRGSELIRSKVCDALAAPLEYQTLNKNASKDEPE